MLVLSVLLGMTVLALVAVVAFGWQRERRQRASAREVESLLILQERKVKQLTAFAQQMQESEAGTRAIIDYALDGIVTIDRFGNIIEFNPAAERLFGYECEEVLGKPIVELLVPPQLRESQRRGWDQFLATGYGPWIGQRVETVGLRADGRQVPVELAITVLHPKQPPMLTAFVRDLSLLKQTSEKLSQSNARLQAVLDAATQAAIVAVDVRGHITLFNRGAERMLGYKGVDVVGRHSPELFLVASELTAHARRLTQEFGTFFSGFDALVERARREGHEEREWTFVRTDGSALTVNVAVTVLRDVRGEISGYLAVATDVTGRRRAALALEQAKEAAEAANRAKSDFLANMSHEIRTPLNGMIGMNSLLMRTPLTPEQRKYAEAARASAESLLGVINDILDVTKLEAGKVQLQPAPMSLGAVIAEVTRALAAQAAQKGLELARHIDPGARRPLMGDVDRVRQVVFNLVSNGVKFTERGGVRVEATSRTEADGRVAVRVSVHDSGIGLSEESKRRLFQTFEQADRSMTRRFDGAGLGLSICRQLVTLMGGEIGAEERPSGGSTFWFEIPFAVAPEVAANDSAPELDLDEAQFAQLARMLPPARFAAMLGAYLTSAERGVADMAVMARRGEPGELADAAQSLRSAAADFGAERLAGICGRIEQLCADGDVAAARPLVEEAARAAAACAEILRARLQTAPARAAAV